MKLKLIITLLLTAPCTYSQDSSKNLVGIFKHTDNTLAGIMYGNSFSSPYEYAWAASVIPITNKRVIDLGVGIPSQYNWHKYVTNHLKPSFYVGIDSDERMQDYIDMLRNEVIKKDHYDMKVMDISHINYPDNSFDVAYCISVYAYMTYDTFITSIKETHRILKNDGLLIVTFNEVWDKNQPITYANSWNTLEQSLISREVCHKIHRSFGLPELLTLIKDYFVVYADDIIVENDIIRSQDHSTIYYDRNNSDSHILNSGLPINKCISYAVLKKIN